MANKTTKGIDVSVHNGTIDFNKVKAAGYDFVILRAGYGRDISQKDNTFERNYKNAKAAGLQVGAYWYSYATSPADAAKEAQTCLQAIAGKAFEMPIYFDLEEQSQTSKGGAYCRQLIDKFCQEMEAAGYYAGVYTSASVANALPSGTDSRYAMWIAHWGVKSPSYTGRYGMWQHTSTASVSGINGNVDGDIAYIDYETVMREQGLNGFPMPKKTPTVETEPAKSASHVITVQFDGETIFTKEV